MTKYQTYEPKPLFVERINFLLPDEKDMQAYWKIIRTKPRASIRCNTLKISPENLKSRLESKGWEIEQPFPDNKEIMIVTSELKPGELGKAIEHILGYYYVQEISSMLPILALDPSGEDLVLDLCASPGSKTTQASARMENSGTILANDKDIGRIAILQANLERVGASNVVMTRHDAVQLCLRLEKLGIKFDKILLDVPCSGEGNIRSNPKTLLTWNIRMIESLSRLQKKIASSAVNLLKENGELIYSTCTQSPEENEENVNFLVERFGMKVLPCKLPVKSRQGIIQWKNKTFDKQIKNCCRIWPQDNDTEGFFLARLKK
ncbi:MAG: RsmB/NOP family class I SAM-dependent RNA methyltransferase [Candidatus Pacearchaeota archaeon]|nr:RsmB/NOP family class I SAM-dependent RNA methyltransferase [Candidatus Pacearchaeota archaeon]